MKTAARAAPGALDYGLLALLALLWGASFPLSKVAVGGFPPWTLTLGRQSVAVAALFGLAFAARSVWFRPLRRELWLIAACALFGSVLPFTLINYGVAHVDSGLAAILMGLMPLVTLVIAHLFTDDEKMTGPKAAGVVLGLAGLALLFWPSLTGASSRPVLAQIALLGAAVCYAVNALFLKRLIARPSLVLMSYIGLASVAMLFPVAFLVEQPFSVTPTTAQTAALFALALMAYTAGALVMFRLVERQGIVFFGQINLLVPVAGVILGAVFLAERLEPRALAALLIIVSGIVLARLDIRPTAVQSGSS